MGESPGFIRGEDVKDKPHTFAEMLSQMRWALQEEIKANQKDKPRYPARFGKDLSTSGVFRYQFQCTARWEPPIDTPLLIEVANVDGTTLEVQGRVESFHLATITIVTEEPLPLHALEQVLLSENTSHLLKQLRGALDGRDETVNQLASKLFGLLEPADGQSSIPIQIGTFTPDSAQRQAIARALGSEVLYLIGPPGTGKTVTLAAIVLLALLQGRSVLVAAHTNIALDNAIVRLVDLVQAHGATLRIEEGQIIRYGTPRLAELASDPYRMVTVRGRTGPLAEEWERLEQERVQRFAEIDREQQQLAGKAQRWHDLRQRYDTTLATYQEQLEVLQGQEQHRLARLEEEWQQLANRVQSTRRVLAQAGETVARLMKDITGLQSTQWQDRERYAEVIALLATIERKGTFSRLVFVLRHGHNVDTLRREASQLMSSISLTQQRLEILRREMETAQFRQQVLTQQISALNERVNQVASVYNTPSAEARQVEQLQTEIRRVRTQHVWGNATHSQAVAQLEQQRREYGSCCQRLAEIKAEIRLIETRSVAEAQVLGATLSALFLHSQLFRRTFDLVVIDEASMASPAAVCLAATCAERGIVVIGDPLQLAPICKAAGAHARKWIGTDVYTLVGVTVEEAAAGERHSALLTHQARMHPRISALVNTIIYKGYLRDRPGPGRAWLRIAPYPEHALLVCDTSNARPRTQRPETGKSRYNSHHVDCVLALVRQALASLPPAVSGLPRIGIVTPYAPQVYELRRCFQEAQLDHFVQVGTVHAYQGLEFDLVIYDTVESPPLRLVPNFTAGGWGSEAMRLVNVALSRAKHKLIIVANVEYLKELRGESGMDHVLVSVVEEAYRQANITSSALFGNHQSQ